MYPEIICPHCNTELDLLDVIENISNTSLTSNNFWSMHDIVCPVCHNEFQVSINH